MSGTFTIQPLDGPVNPITPAVPGDKSIAHRGALFAALAEGQSLLTGFPAGADNQSTLQVLSQLGVQIDRDADTIVVHGAGLRGLRPSPTPLDCGNSGTTMRLVAGILSGTAGEHQLIGDASLSRRPMARIIQPLSQMGADIRGINERPPLYIRGQKLVGCRWDSPIASAQVKSAILLAGLHASGTTTVTEPMRSRDHTERMLSAMGAPLEIDGLQISLSAPAEGFPTDLLRPLELQCPGDPSAASFFASLAPVGSGQIDRIALNPGRIGLFHLLSSHGIKLAWHTTGEAAGEPVGTLQWQQSTLQKPLQPKASEIVDAIDEYPLLCVLAAVSEGTHILRHAEELRSKESDRIAVMADLLRRAGAQVEERPDGLIIKGGVPLHAVAVDPHHDHRIAMASAILAILGHIEVRISDAQIAQVSFPTFYSCLEQTGLAAISTTG